MRWGSLQEAFKGRGGSQWRVRDWAGLVFIVQTDTNEETGTEGQQA